MKRLLLFEPVSSTMFAQAVPPVINEVLSDRFTVMVPFVLLNETLNQLFFISFVGVPGRKGLDETVSVMAKDAPARDRDRIKSLRFKGSGIAGLFHLNFLAACKINIKGVTVHNCGTL